LKTVDEMWFSGYDNWNVSSLKIICALYSMDTALLALIRYYWGVCKPLMGEYFLSAYYYVNLFSDNSNSSLLQLPLLSTTFVNGESFLASLRTTWNLRNTSLW
jgi:hypothetical protein